MIKIEIKHKEALMQFRKEIFSRLDMSEVLNEFGVHMVQNTDNTFEALSSGGDYRGVHWPDFAVFRDPKWFGKDEPRGGWKVRKSRYKLGKMRKEGSDKKWMSASSKDFVTRDSKLLQHEGFLRRGVVNSLKVDGDGMRMTANREYAHAQQKIRPYLFFQIPNDAKLLKTIAMRRLSGSDR